MDRRPVTAEDARPAGKAGECFYCRETIGNPHGPECVLITKTVWLRVTIDFQVDVPAHWDSQLIESARGGELSYCADNIVADLEKFTKRMEENDEVYDCLCSHIAATVLDAEPHGNPPKPSAS